VKEDEIFCYTKDGIFFPLFRSKESGSDFTSSIAETEIRKPPDVAEADSVPIK
jgi:hypothetical protein